MQTLLIANQKGGVGKSAIATQIALYAASLGYRVVAIDLDHQANFCAPLLRSGQFANAGDSTLLLEEALPAAWKPALGERTCAVFGAGVRLSGLERTPTQHNDYATFLRDACRVRLPAHFDLCVIDVNPNPDIRFGAAMIAATHLLVPIQLNQEAIDGVKAIIDHPRFGFARIKAGFNPELELLGMLPNLFEATPFQKANLISVMQHYGGYLFRTDTPNLDSNTAKPAPQFGCIPTRTAVAEAQAAGQFIGAGKKTSHRDAWKQLEPIFAAVLRRVGVRAQSAPLALSAAVASNTIARSALSEPAPHHDMTIEGEA